MGFGFWLLESGLVDLTRVVVGNWFGCFGGWVGFGLPVGVCCLVEFGCCGLGFCDLGFMWVIYFLAGFSGFGDFGGFVGACVWVSGFCGWGLLGNFLGLVLRCLLLFAMGGCW